MKKRPKSDPIKASRSVLDAVIAKSESNKKQSPKEAVKKKTKQN